MTLRSALPSALFLALAIASASAQKPLRPQPKPATKARFQDAPLTVRERASHLLDRFTFGARPGEVEKLIANGQDGTDKWFESQLNPGSIPDGDLERRLRDYPTLAMTPGQTLATFPDRGVISRIADGKAPMPTDPQLKAVYEVQIYKLQQERDAKKLAQTVAKDSLPAGTKDRRKEADRATAARIAGDLFALPKGERMKALLALPVADRSAFASNLEGQQRNTLLADFTSREREYFLTMANGVGPSYLAVNELVQGRMLRDIVSERQLQAVVADFWFNHFNIFAQKDSDQWYTTAYERDVIRKNALGNFSDLLVATATSPAMMIYLDNWLSIGPNSPANGGRNPNGKRGNRGLNENYAREVMELHTLSVNGEYSQADVTSLAALFTGWTIDHPELAGPFAFDPQKHEPGVKHWLGQTIEAGEESEGLQALKVLAMSPKTAHFISYKLAQRFVADEPPPALVDRLAQTYQSTGGDISQMLRAMVHSPEFNSRKYFRNKVKTPVEFIASTFRATATDPSNPGALTATLERMGMGLCRALSPTGYYITADKWMNTGALLDRLNFALTLTSGKFNGQKFDSSRLLALGLMSQPAGTMPSTLAIRASLPTVSALPTQSTAHLRDIKLGGKSLAKEGLEEVPAPSTTAATGSSAVATGTGAELALSVLETSLVGGEVSAQTNSLILQQLHQSVAAPGSNSSSTLDTITALVLGAPEFQLR